MLDKVSHAALIAPGRRHKMRFGAEVTSAGVGFRLWAPFQQKVEVVVEGVDAPIPMMRSEDGWHRGDGEGIRAGALYRYRLDDGSLIPDPASRHQPEGIHGPSEVIDPEDYSWTDTDWSGRPWEEAVIYELHVGAFTSQGSFRAATERLDHLAALGITAIELLPISQFPGNFNWGYDGAMLFAPDSSYGRPEDLKALVEAAHRRSIMVFLDVVYNHFGPDGNNIPLLGPVFTDSYASPWGPALNYGSQGAAVVRELMIDNAIYWLREFNFDGLRLDAVHEIRDDSTSHILEVVSARARAATPGRHVHLVVENAHNEERWLRRDAGLIPVHFTAQWNDDVHHVLHTAATGEKTGYYRDFARQPELLAQALAEGFAYQGGMMPALGKANGEPSAGLPATAFISYIQNHDQVGNRVRGDRMTVLAPAEALQAIAAVYLLMPQIPMIFMGEEWGAAQPFPFFSDVKDELKEPVLKGRIEQLKTTPEHEDPTKPNVEDTPDPSDPATFLSAKLDWNALKEPDHIAWRQLYQLLISTRRGVIVPRLRRMEGFSTSYAVIGDHAVTVEWRLGDGSVLTLYANLSPDPVTGITMVDAPVIWQQGEVAPARLGPWSVVWMLR